MPAVVSSHSGVLRPESSSAHPDQTNLTSLKGSRAAVEHDSSDERRRLAIGLILGALLLAVVAVSVGEKREGRSELTLLGPDGKRTISEVMGVQRPKTFEERVRQNRQEIGAKLNRDRIRMQYENLNLPIPGVRVSPANKDRLMHGLPLESEPNSFRSYVPKRSEPKQSIELDVQSRVQFEKDLDRWEQAAQEQYIREFKDNARAMGYEVKIDKDYNVDWQPIGGRSPQSTGAGVK